ncbi:MAG: hypothetical protein ACRD43_03015, partial [Pyrinomonadaceae bacterium]
MESNPATRGVPGDKKIERSSERVFERKTSMLRSLLAIVLVLAFAFDLINAQENQSEIDLVHYGDVIDVDVVGSLDFDWRGTLNPEGFLDGMERIEDPVYAL